MTKPAPHQLLLVGQYDSPFVRRVAIALHHYGVTFDRDKRSVFADQAALAVMNPVGRVPMLVFDQDEVLIDSATILDAVDELYAGSSPLIPVSGYERRRVLKLSAVALGCCEKAVGCLYELHKKGVTDADWLKRLQQQTTSGLRWLDRYSEQLDELNHGSIATAVLVRFIKEYLPEMAGALPSGLKQAVAPLEALAAFKAAPFERD